MLDQFLSFAHPDAAGGVPATRRPPSPPPHRL